MAYDSKDIEAEVTFFPAESGGRKKLVLQDFDQRLYTMVIIGMHHCGLMAHHLCQTEKSIDVTLASLALNNMLGN